jgi:hypothetical protein
MVTAGLMWAPDSRPSGETAISATHGATIAPSTKNPAPRSGSASATGDPRPSASDAAATIASTISAVPVASAAQIRQWKPGTGDVTSP